MRENKAESDTSAVSCDWKRCVKIWVSPRVVKICVYRWMSHCRGDEEEKKKSKQRARDFCVFLEVSWICCWTKSTGALTLLYFVIHEENNVIKTDTLKGIGLEKLSKLCDRQSNSFNLLKMFILLDSLQKLVTGVQIKSSVRERYDIQSTIPNAIHCNSRLIWHDSIRMRLWFNILK